MRDIVQWLWIVADVDKETGDLALGTYEATLLDLTAAYAALVYRGVLVRPYAVQVVRGNNGHRLYTRLERSQEPVFRLRMPSR